MLSMKKVKIHGIKDNRWTTKDKISQYRGVINLFTRDQKITQVDSNVQFKKYDKEIKSLKKEILENRFKLDNAIYGDKQIIKNILAEYEEFRLAFQDLEPTKIVEYVHQNTFNKRKLLDLINYKIKEKRDRLVDLKLEVSILEDRLKYEVFDKFPIELEAASITGKVQDANLKREAALVVQYSYKAILDVMKKDHNYMFQVLEALLEDARNQGRCMFSTTQIGQLATEYLDDRRNEFEELETAIKIDMKVREEDLRKVREQVENVDKDIKHLIRRDSDITVGINRHAFVRDISEGEVGNLIQLDELEHDLKYLMNVTMVSSFDFIFPCIQDQYSQTERLNKLVKELQEQRNTLFNKVKHVHQMHKQLTFVKGESTYGYEIEKERLLNLIREQKEKARHINQHNIFKCDVMLKIRIALQRIEEMCTVVHDTIGEKKRAKILGSSPSTYSIVHDNVAQSMEALESKLKLLTSASDLTLQPNQLDQAYSYMHQLMDKVTCTVDLSAKVLDESLIEGIVLEDANVPSRQDIKKWSKELVESNTKDADLMLIPPPKRKKYKFQK